ncbi:MAG: AAA family ATPase [Actinobacteria bacterium]|nr:AAA family ATPase [Actinomycetota bacterium]
MATATASPPDGGVSTLRRIAAGAAGVDIDATALEGPGEGSSGGRTIPLGRGREPYTVRRIAGMDDVEFIRTAIEAGFNVCLYGPPGTGKTTLVEAALGEGRVITQEFSEGTQVEDITGSFFPAPEKGWEWGDGSLTRALREGKLWFGDDITQGDPRVQSRVFPALDSRRRLTLNECGGEVVEADDGFGAIIAYNPNLPGTTFSEALASRCAIHVYVGFDAPTARRLGVPADAVTAAQQLNRHLEAQDPLAGIAPGEAGPATWAPQLRELLAFKAVARVFDPLTAARNLLGLCPEESRVAMSEALQAHVSGGVELDPLRVE